MVLLYFRYIKLTLFSSFVSFLVSSVLVLTPFIRIIIFFLNDHLTRTLSLLLHDYLENKKRMDVKYLGWNHFIFFFIDLLKASTKKTSPFLIHTNWLNIQNFTYYKVAFFSSCVCRWGPCVCHSWVRWAGSFISRKSPVCPSTTPSWPPVPDTASVMLDTGPLTPWALRKVCFSAITITINILLTLASKQMACDHPTQSLTFSSNHLVQWQKMFSQSLVHYEMCFSRWRRKILLLVCQDWFTLGSCWYKILSHKEFHSTDLDWLFRVL